MQFLYYRIFEKNWILNQCKNLNNFSTRYIIIKSCNTKLQFRESPMLVKTHHNA